MNNFHRMPIKREEVRIKTTFAMESAELERILSEAKSQEHLTGYPKIAHDDRRWLLISQAFNFHARTTTLELLRLE